MANVLQPLLHSLLQNVAQNPLTAGQGVGVATSSGFILLANGSSFLLLADGSSKLKKAS